MDGLMEQEKETLVIFLSKIKCQLWMDVWMDVWMDGRERDISYFLIKHQMPIMDGWMDGWMEEEKETSVIFFSKA